MKPSLLPLLACPVCGESFELVSPSKGGDIEMGELRCARCQHDYPIRGGIPRLRPPGGIPSDATKTRESFGWEWLRYPGSRPIDEPTFLEETMIPREVFAGKMVLDAGCGMGRYSAVALSLGAEVVAIDMSESLIRVAESARTNPKLHPVEGDLLRPPFKKKAFDIVYSQGVLHHTSDTRTAFGAVASLVKTGGLLSVWLYGKAGRFIDFATNPIRPGREWIARHRRLAWSIVLIRHTFSDLIRALTTRLPIPVTYVLCYPLAAFGALPGFKYLTFSVDFDFSARVIENFDWLSPPYQWHHTKEELSGWYAQEGFEVLKILPHRLVPKPGVLGRKSAA